MGAAGRRKQVTLAEKFRYLREMEGELRGLHRAMTQQELLRAIEAETGQRLSQSYLSQIESGARPHLTNTTRLLLSRFFKVHPGYLVDDPVGYHAELLSDARVLEDKLDLWLISGAERFGRDPKLCRALLALAQHADSRRCLLLLESILESPTLTERLMEVLRPEDGAAGRPSTTRRPAATLRDRAELPAGKAVANTSAAKKSMQKRSPGKKAQR